MQLLGQETKIEDMKCGQGQDQIRPNHPGSHFPNGKPDTQGGDLLIYVRTSVLPDLGRIRSSGCFWAWDEFPLRWASNWGFPPVYLLCLKETSWNTAWYERAFPISQSDIIVKNRHVQFLKRRFTHIYICICMERHSKHIFKWKNKLQNILWNIRNNPLRVCVCVYILVHKCIVKKLGKICTKSLAILWRKESGLRKVK